MVVSVSPSPQHPTLQMTAGSVSSTRSEACAEEGRNKDVQRGEKIGAQVCAVDVVISDEGRGVTLVLFPSSSLTK